MVPPGLFAGQKAAVCGAGPSLNGATIAGVSQIFACNSALQHLLRQGVAVTGAGDSFKQFVEDMEKAVEAMGPASDQLKASKWQEALGPEQKALQHLLPPRPAGSNLCG